MAIPEMRMDIAADLGQLVEMVEDLGDYWHAGSGGWEAGGGNAQHTDCPAFPTAASQIGHYRLRACTARGRA